MSLKNENYANKTLITAYGELQFDEQGIIQTELSLDAIEALSTLKGFERLEVKDNDGEKDEKDEDEVKEDEVKDEDDTQTSTKSKRGSHLNQKK